MDLNIRDRLSGDKGLINLLVEHQAIISDHFLLSGGECTEFFVAKERILSAPEVVKAFGERLANALVGSGIRPNTIIGPQRYGLILAHQLALTINQISGRKVNYVCVCKDSTGKLEIAPSELELLVPPIVVVDDVVTSYGTLNKVRALIEEHVDEFIGYACLIDRTLEIGPQLTSLVRASLPRYKQGECPMCAENRPWNQTWGHGRQPATEQLSFLSAS